MKYWPSLSIMCWLWAARDRRNRTTLFSSFLSFFSIFSLSLYTPQAAAGNLCVYAFERSPQQHDVCKARAWSECEWMEKKNCRWQNWPSLLIAFCCCCSRLESYQKRPVMRKVTRVAGGRASFNFTNDKISSLSARSSSDMISAQITLVCAHMRRDNKS